MTTGTAEASVPVCAASLGAALLAGCAPLPAAGQPGPGDPEYDRWNMYSEAGVPVKMVDGCWGFRDQRGTYQFNLIERYNDAIIHVTAIRQNPAGQRRVIDTQEYVRLNYDYYEDSDGPGAYTFGNGSAFWHSNDGRNLRFQLEYIGIDC